MLAKTYIQGQHEKKAFEELSSIAAQEAEKTPDEPQYTGYVSLYEQNKDFIGWLHISNTNIDYPVMFTPEEPEYYLRRAFDGSYSISGTPFASVDVDSDLFIIYGHNMKNGTMFGTLDNYSTKDFWEGNPSVFFTTITESREYEVFAAVQTRILLEEEAGYRYYSQAGDLTEEAFNELLNWLDENALYDTGIRPTYGEQIVILSTCSYHTENGRFLIAGKRVDNSME